MNWAKKDKGMSPDEAKERTISLLNLWLIWLSCRKLELYRMHRSWRKDYGRARDIAASHIKNPLVRRILKIIEGLCHLSARLTRRRIIRLKANVWELIVAMKELNGGRPDPAMELLCENFPAESDSSLVDGLSGLGMSVFYIRLLDGLRRVGKA